MKMMLVILLLSGFLFCGCGVSRTLAFSDGTCVVATVYDSHSLVYPFLPKEKVVLRDESSGLELRFRQHVCEPGLMLECIKDFASEYQSASLFLRAYLDGYCPDEGE